MDHLQQQAKALGDPTRYEVFGYLADAGRPVDIAELTEHLDLNHNSIRQHLAKLVAAELVVEAKAASNGRGRPRLIYTLHPSAESRWGVVGPYERLSLLLTEVVQTGDTPIEVGRRAGRRLRLGHTAGDDPIAGLLDAMAGQGFDPVARRNGAKVDIVLQTCPFESSAVADPDSICALHLGLAYGAADTLGGVEITGLEPRDPRRAQCRLHCRLTPG
ncbi:MAG: helix-turn-helix transcriptional regulator [Acidimicrobiales bacterium]